jgi:hypothetical protein
VKVEGRDLIFVDNKQFFGVDLTGAGLQILGIAVADGEKEQTAIAVVSLTEVGDVPAQAALDNFTDFVAFGAPFVGRPVGEGGQVKLVLANESVGILNESINFGTFHGSSHMC